MSAGLSEQFAELDVRKIRCVAFDFVGTLVFANPPVAEVYGAVARRYGSGLSDVEIRRRFSEAYRRAELDDSSLAGRMQTNEARERCRWQGIVSSVLDDVADPQQCFAELFAWFGRPNAWGVYPDVAEALCELAAAGYGLAIASNFDGRLHSVCDGHAELRAIPLRGGSSLVGYRKPSLQFYRALTEAARSQPEQVLMIGDDESNDVRGARESGLQAVQLDRAADGGRRDVLRSLAELPRILRHIEP